MRSGENADQPLSDAQRNRDFRPDRSLARYIVRIFADVGRIPRLPSRGYVTDHSFFADFQAIALVVFAKALHSGEHHLSALFIVQVDTGFEASERIGDFADDAVNQLVKIENGRNFL